MRPLVILFVLVVLLVIGGECSGRKKEGGGWKPPSFNTDLPTNLTVLEGEAATLTCEVTRLRGRAVSWIRQRDLHVISADNLIFTTDNRFQIKVDNSTAVWRLVVSPALRNDSGAYECQVNTRPKLSWTVNLNVKIPVALLEGPRELYIKSGSTLVLTCTATLHPDASSSVNWKHNGSEISITSPRGGVSIETEKEGRQLMSRLSLVHALASDAGNYTCEPDLVTPANVSVYVVEDEVPAAMAHDAGPSGQPSILLILASCLLVPSAAAAAMAYGSKSVSNGHRRLNRLPGKGCQVRSQLSGVDFVVSPTFRGKCTPLHLTNKIVLHQWLQFTSRKATAFIVFPIRAYTEKSELKSSSSNYMVMQIFVDVLRSKTRHPRKSFKLTWFQTTDILGMLSNMREMSFPKSRRARKLFTSRDCNTEEAHLKISFKESLLPKYWKFSGGTTQEKYFEECFVRVDFFPTQASYEFEDFLSLERCLLRGGTDFCSKNNDRIHVFSCGHHQSWKNGSNKICTRQDQAIMDTELL